MTLTLRLGDATDITYVTADESRALAAEEHGRFVALVGSLGEADWGKPTACTAWTVRDILAHQAGSYAGAVGYRQLLGQLAVAFRPGKQPVDAINERQLAERAGRSPTELIAELRDSGAAAITNRAYGFRLMKPVSMPDPVAGRLSMRHLMMVIYSRDTWMHRLDICRATGRRFEQTPEHDGRINALVVRDLAEALGPKLGGKAIALELAGIAGGSWRIGTGENAATIGMDTLDFNIYASGRFTREEAARKATFYGDRTLAEMAFNNFAVLY